MNMFFGGRLKGMPPKLVSDDGRHVVIRPLAYVAEADLERWAARARVPDHSVQPVRQPAEPAARSIGTMLRDWEREDPGRIDRIFDAMGTRRALAPDGPEPVRLRRRSQADRHRRRRGRPRLRPSDADAWAALHARRADAHEKRHRRSSPQPLPWQAAHRSTTSTPTSRRFSRWPAGRAPATYAFERLPSQQAQPQQAQCSRTRRGCAIEGAGFVPAPEGSVADVTMQLGARITATDRSPFDDPFWYGGYGG